MNLFSAEFPGTLFRVLGGGRAPPQRKKYAVRKIYLKLPGRRTDPF
jgi:hypothetical protein